jgi:hypothetical protein
MAADVTPHRLVNADNEPQNWLMNHRAPMTASAFRHLRINRDTVRNLKTPLQHNVTNVSVE